MRRCRNFISKTNYLKKKLHDSVSLKETTEQKAREHNQKYKEKVWISSVKLFFMSFSALMFFYMLQLHFLEESVMRYGWVDKWTHCYPPHNSFHFPVVFSLVLPWVTDCVDVCPDLSQESLLAVVPLLLRPRVAVFFEGQPPWEHEALCNVSKYSFRLTPFLPLSGPAVRPPLLP